MARVLAYAAFIAGNTAIPCHVCLQVDATLTCDLHGSQEPLCVEAWCTRRVRPNLFFNMQISTHQLQR